MSELGFICIAKIEGDMKNLILILMAACLVSAASVQAQDMDKALAKAWKKKLKQTDPMEFKRIVEEREALTADIVKARQENIAHAGVLATREAEIAALKEEVENLKARPREVAQPAAKGPVPNTVASGEGVTYKVQIGAFRNKDLVKFFKNSPNFSGDVDSDGAKKYTLGQFTDYWEADNFKKYLREMGVIDAWVVSYKNGERVNIKDALEGAL